MAEPYSLIVKMHGDPKTSSVNIVMGVKWFNGKTWINIQSYTYQAMFLWMRKVNPVQLEIDK